MSSPADTPVPRPASARGFRTGRRGLLCGMLAMVGLTGCGFRPLYGPEGDVADALASVDVDVIRERSGQILRADLMSRFNPDGRPADPLYRLNVGISETSTSLDVQDGRVGTRRNLTVTAQYTLRRTADSETVTSGRVRTITSYNEFTDEFATLAAERDARERALRQTAEDVRRRIAVHFGQPEASG